MKIYDRSSLSEIKNLEDGTLGLFEYVDCGRCYQDLFMVVGGEMFFETESCYNDLKSSSPLKCFYRYEGDNYYVAVVNLDGSIEVF